MYQSVYVMLANNGPKIFAEWQHRFTDHVSMTGGLHSSRLFLNNSYAIEPRLGMKWEFTPGQTVSFGTGLHSQNQMKAVYFTQLLIDSIDPEVEKLLLSCNFILLFLKRMARCL